MDGMKNIKHLVVLMMENRSFDHYLGDLSLSEGRTDVDGLTNPLPTNPDIQGKQISCWNMDGNFGGYGDPPHGYGPQHSNYDSGRNDGFVKSYQAGFPGGTGQQASKIPMGYYTRATLPVTYALTDHFTLCDRWFGSILSSTWPNRKYFMSGKRDQDNDTQTLPKWPGFKTTPFLKAFEKHINPDTGKKCTWKGYFSDLPFLGFWYKFAATHLDNFKFIFEFAEDCKNGTLPDISIIDPPFGFADDHPSYDVRRGQKFVGLVIDAITNSPSWKDTAVLLTYDENGGFYDHVPPPSSFADGQPLPGDLPFGFRVPAIIMSPYSGRKVSHIVYEHTTLMKTVSERWGIQFDPATFDTRWQHAPSIWRDCFDFGTANPIGMGTYTTSSVPELKEAAAWMDAIRWEDCALEMVAQPPGGVLEKIERIFALPQLRRLDNRSNVFDHLNRMEELVAEMKSNL